MARKSRRKTEGTEIAREPARPTGDRASRPSAEGEGELVRAWGPNTISDFQLRNMGLERTHLTFPGGYYLRKIEKKD